MNPVYAKVRIKSGATCTQDFKLFTWPPSQYRCVDFGVADDTVFVAEKRQGFTKCEWICRAAGAGLLSNYGDGAITATDVEFLTPASFVMPEVG
ncbi:MAG: hypothetical protein GY938_01185 [Ketobacter sp.]|nr:hypothetical protein [Ketobacter sp.]